MDDHAGLGSWTPSGHTGGQCVGVGVVADLYGRRQPGAAIFLDPSVRTLWRDWAALTEAVVARLRVLAGGDLDDPHLGELVAELSVRSDEFRRLWARQDIQIPTARPTIFDHPLVGTLELQPERLAILGTEGQLLIVCHAEPGSPSEQRLLQLARIAAGTP